MEKEKNFSFDSIGKRMPYRMPGNVMADIQEAVMEELRGELPAAAPRIVLRRNGLFRTIVSAAAAVTLFLVCYSTMQPAARGSYDDVETAFDNLSYDDQAFMIDTYNNDVFACASDMAAY